jgi:hypothetical protein
MSATQPDGTTQKLTGSSAVLRRPENWLAIFTAAGWLFVAMTGVVLIAAGSHYDIGEGGGFIFLAAYTSGAIAWGWFLHWLRTSKQMTEMTAEIAALRARVLEMAAARGDGPQLAVVRDLPSR